MFNSPDEARKIESFSVEIHQHKVNKALMSILYFVICNISCLLIGLKGFSFYLYDYYLFIWYMYFLSVARRVLNQNLYLKCIS